MSQEDEKREFYLAFLRSKEQELLAKLKLPHVKTQRKKFFSEQGTFFYQFIYVRRNGRLFSPLREYLGLGPFQNMSNDFRAKLVMKATRTSYQKCAEDILDSFNVTLCKKTIQRYVVQVHFPRVAEKPLPRQKIFLCDSTKVRNGHKGHHNVTAAVSLDAETNSASLAARGVNQPLDQLLSSVDMDHYDAFVGDGDMAFRPVYAKGIPFHLCHQHATRDLSFFIWQEKMGKEERKEYKNRFEALLYSLQNSTNKYWADHDSKRLSCRIDITRDGIGKLAEDLEKAGMAEAPRFLREHREHLLTASILALKGIRVPFTTNYIEKVMQEIGVRTKKKGMNWGEQGLSAIMGLTLSRFFAPPERRCYKLALCSDMQVSGT